MEHRSHDRDGRRSFVDLEKVAKTTREKLRELGECNKVVPEEEALALPVDKVSSSGDEVDEILEAEYRRLNDALDLPVDTYSLTKVNTNLTTSVKYGVRSGLTHRNMDKFSPLSRGLQGGAVAIAAFATTELMKARCWNELIIDEILEDGDTYYCESYERLDTDDRSSLTVLDLKRDFLIQKTHRVHISIDEPAYAGKFRSGSPTDLHLVKALELFFKKYDAGVLSSSVLNVAIWKDSKCFNIFDAQPRKTNLLPAEDASGGTAKLIVVRDIAGVVFIVLEKSGVKNEDFVLYGLGILAVHKLTPNEDDDPEEPEKTLGKPRRRTSGYKIQDKYRALVRGSFHLSHELVSPEFRDHSHPVIALAALIYSRLVNANKWTTAMVDLIFNQAHIYLVDLARALEKKLDDSFEMTVDDILADVILGVYTAKVEVRANVVPGQAKKGKATIDTGVREFFASNDSGILEIKKKFYAVWKEASKYYLFDPFACDDQGFRVDPADPENLEKYNEARACVTMNSSIDQLVETILENTGNKEKDPFVIHGFKVLYVKTGSISGNSSETIVYREKKTNRRPLPPKAPQLETLDDCKVEMDLIPRARPNAERTKEAFNQYPELMSRVKEYAMKDDEPTTFIEGEPDARGDLTTARLMGKEQKDGSTGSKQENLAARLKEGDRIVEIREEEVAPDKTRLDFSNDVPIEEEVKLIKGYSVINPHRIILHGSKNCLAEDFHERSRGRQGLALALTAIAYAKIKDPTTWRNLDLDQILQVGNRAYSDIVTWIREGSREATVGGEMDEEGEGEEEEEEELEEEEEEPEEGDAAESKPSIGFVKAAPSHIDISALPAKIKLADNEVTYKTKARVVEGEADPLVNLGEALERYFQRYNEAILENKRLMYGIWKHDNKYFLLNSYGSDEEGWRLEGYPVSLVVADTINELTDSLHGVLEFNDRIFSLHFVGIESIQPGDKYIATTPVDVPEEDTIEMYRTIFLPITDQDLFVPQLSVELQAQTTDAQHQEDEDKDEEDEDEEEDEEPKDKEDEVDADLVEERTKPEKPLENPLLEVEEKERPDAPDHLNLSLLTGSVKMEKDEVPNEELNEALAYERLKYNHPPPYVLPPRKVVCVLLETKKASRSMHSLVSRFSIDSKLAVKAATDLGKLNGQPPGATVASSSEEKKSVKIIKLPPTKYLFSRITPQGFTPLRAIDEKFIRDEDLDKAAEDECRKNKAEQRSKKFIYQEIPEGSIGLRITPEIVPLGPTIKTPTPKKRSKDCVDHQQARKCKLTELEKEDKLLEKMLCNTEDVLFDIIFPSRRNGDVIVDAPKNEVDDDSQQGRGAVDGAEASGVRIKAKETAVSEDLGFFETENNVGIIEGNTCLLNRSQTEDCHFKACFFAGILCILAKVQTDVNRFRGTILDELVLASDKIYRGTGKLRYKGLRWFRNVVILGAKCNVALKQSVYADPESCEAEQLSRVLESYVAKNQTGILVLSNASYAFWFANDQYYLFDPYACDDRGLASESGYACLLKFCDLRAMIDRIKLNNGAAAESPYRIYSLSIAHMEPDKRRRRRTRRKRKRCSSRESEKSIPDREEEREEETEKPKKELSLTELIDWVIDNDEPHYNALDTTLSGFVAVKNVNASALEVVVVENDISRPELAPLKKLKARRPEVPQSSSFLPLRKKCYDRKFAERTTLSKAIDLCVMAWSCVHDPVSWGVRTIRAIYEASKELTFDSLLAAKDSTVTEMIDDVLTDFSIANYSFRAVFAPLHRGRLYAPEGWNLAMSLKKLFDIPIYTGGIIVCGTAHIGVIKKGACHYAWWTVRRTKNLRIIASEVLHDFLKLIIKAIGESEEKLFLMRLVTISYARKLEPDCSDLAGLHEPAIPVTSLPQIHPKESAPYDVDAIFRSTIPTRKGIFVLGTVALRNRDSINEPKVKRCYFVALLSVMVKRDIIQSPVPSMIDKIIQVAENLYKEFDLPKYHTEHLLKNVTVMNRVFDFRDCASSLFTFTENPHTGKNDFYSVVSKQLKMHLKKHTDGIIHFTNCCYGFWYSRSTNAYYYVDPYPCDSRGRRVDNLGAGSLGIFSSICEMARQMCVNRFEDTTGFFIHRLHVESINVQALKNFEEDPMWVYLDYHWSFRHSPKIGESRRKTRRRRIKRVCEYENDDISKESEKEKCRSKPTWNNYAIDVANLIYSVWGTLGCYDTRFGERAGKNRAAVCLAILSMQYLCHPSKWSAAILDSAIICGDSYYTESLKSAARGGSKNPSNQFNLQPCFKVYPHIWSIEFCGNMCGILYGSRDTPCLARTLKLAFEKSSNLVVECGKVTIAVLSCDDGFYVADPCWTGPPLFSKNHGAVYALRCRNFNALIYAITKIFNTNHRLEFRITPVMFDFSQEICKFADRQKKILVDATRMSPGKAYGPNTPLPGAITVTGEDHYFSYHGNIINDNQLEDPLFPSSISGTIVDDAANNLILISTEWHLNAGQASKKKRSVRPFQTSFLEPESRGCKTCSVTEKIKFSDRYPKIIDFVAGNYITQSTKTRAPPMNASLSSPLDCLPPRNFLQDASRREFNKSSKRMADQAYKTYKHRVNLDVGERSSSPETDEQEMESKAVDNVDE